MKAVVLIAFPLWLATLVLSVMALLLAELGGPAWAFVVLFAWFLTGGLPTTVAVVVGAALWEGGGLPAFVAYVAVAGLVLHAATVAGTRLVWKRWRAGSRRVRTT